MHGCLSRSFHAGFTSTSPARSARPFEEGLIRNRRPTLYALDSFPYKIYNASAGGTINYHCLIGRVDCGSSGIIIAQPFGNLLLLHNGNSTSTSTNVYYDPSVFESTMLLAYPKAALNDINGTITTHLQTLFTNEQWACLTNPTTNPDRNGFFVVTMRDDTTKAGDAANWSVEITDGSSGKVVDEMLFLDTRSGGCGSPDQTPSTVRVSLTPLSASGSGVVGLAQPVTMQVTNQSSVQAYGATVSFTLDNAFDFAGAGGPQGSASFNSTNRLVVYTLGPLLGGTSAKINFQLVPLRAGAAVPGTSPMLALGAGLTNSAANAVSFSPLQSVEPILDVTPTLGGIQLGWSSDSVRLAVEGSWELGSGESWSPTTNRVLQADNGSHHFLGITIPSQQDYFRLHGQ